MESVFDSLLRFLPARFVFSALVASAVGIALLLSYILLRRASRRRYLRRRDARTLALRQQWPQILRGVVPPDSWRFDPLSRDIVESILTDQLEVAGPKEAEQLLGFLRASGLLDMRIYEARALRGWARRQALVSLGRMRAPEAVPALAEALDDPDVETRLAAVRGLGRTALPAAAEPLLERVIHHALRVPERPLLNALLSCCRANPSVLLPYLRKADDGVRPVLARVLGDVATAELDEDLLLLAGDPLPEVRASAARALGQARPRLALSALANLATSEEWFVRLRAVVAMGELSDPKTIPVLIETLCDPNRYVRLRSAAALARFEDRLEEILEQVMQTRDRYALQALVSELERSGQINLLVEGLRDPKRRLLAESALLGALRAGTQRILLDALANHPDWRVRVAVARLLARSGETRLLGPLERLDAAAKSARERRVTRWLLSRLRGGDTAGDRRQKVPA